MQPAPSHARSVRVRRWVVRNEDVTLFKSIGAALATAAASDLLIGKVTLSAVVGVAVALTNLARDARGKGAVVNELEVFVLILVKNAGTTGVNPRSVVSDCVRDGYREQDVQEAIASLKAKGRSDGVVVALIQEDGRGQLHTNI